MKTILLLSFFLLRVTFIFSQPYEIKRIGLEHGLSSNYIMGIAQDQRGFMWFSTESGLNRFDGQKFRVYKKNNTSPRSISGNELNVVYADKYDDIIWVATQRNGLNAFDCTTETFRYYQYIHNDTQSLSTNDVTNVVNSRDGNLWITTYHAGFNYFDKKTGKFTRYNRGSLPDLVSDGVWTLAEDKNGLLYIGHVNSGLTVFSLRDQTMKNYVHYPDDPHSLPGNKVYTVFIDNNDNIWIGTDMGLALFDPKKDNFTVFRHNPRNDKSLVANFVMTINQLEDGRLCIGTENGGISILNIQQSMFQSPENIHFDNIRLGDDKYSLSNPTVRSIYQDSFKNIWIGTYGGGINFIANTPSLFQTWTYSPIPNIPASLSYKTAWGICADAEDNIWIGTDGGGIDVFKNGRRIRTYRKEKNEISDNAVLAAFKDSDNNLWFGTFYGGANLYSAKQKNIAPIKIDGPLDIRCFTEDKQGNIWIGDSKGAYVFNLKRGKIKSYTKRKGELRDDLVRSIRHAKDENIWIGFFGEGLSIYDSEMNLIRSLKTENGLPSNMINYIYEDKDGNMWVGTGEGLVMFRQGRPDDKFIIFNENDGLADSHIKAIAEDKQHNIWVSTSGGIISLYHRHQSRFYNYNHYDGVPLGGFMSGSVTQTSENTLYFGSQGGVCYFNPVNFPGSIDIPPVTITEFKIYDDNLELSESEANIPVKPLIELNYDRNTFHVSFNVLDYSLKHLVEYTYMLKGLDDLWHNTQGENSMTFRNIPPGNYELLIKPRVRNQEWSEHITSLFIRINPPFWFTWWAKVIYVILVISVIVIVMRFYKRKLDLENSLLLEKRNHQQDHELNAERLRFFTNITHELRTPLTLILGPLEDLNSDNNLPEKYSSRISVIYQSATRLLNLINQILEFRKTETQNKKLTVRRADLTKLIQETALKYKELNIKPDLSFHTDIRNGSYLLYYDADIITTILDNLLSNAFKYTEKGNITLMLRNIEVTGTANVEITVKDTGRGIHPDSLSRIFDRYYQEKNSFQNSGTGIGLALVKNLVSLHQGEIFVESLQGEGTTFRFRLTKDNKYPHALHMDSEESNQHKEPENNLSPENETEVRTIVLVIEDNKDINKYIVESLSEHYQVYSALDGKEGVEKAYRYIPDIIISDIMMPGLDGLQLTQQLKDDIRTSHIPIILLTAKDTIQDRTEGYTVGAESYITKPFSSNLLRSRISNILESRRKIAEQLKEHMEDKTTMITESLNALDREFVKKVSLVIEENIDSDDLDVSFIAEKMCMSHSTLYRKIKALTGITTNEFIRKVRLAKAEELLLTGKYTVSEVSYMIGMNNINYFRQCFKEKFGLPPSEYIKQIKNRF